MNISEFIYTVVLRPSWIKKIVNRIILLILPKLVRINDAVICINPRDPVVSGALAFGVYENDEILLINRICKPGQIVVDIGANVGLYTALSGIAVGANGKVFSFEPDPESFDFLKQTVRINNLENVILVNAAASKTAGKAVLHTSSQNRGDNRLYLCEESDGMVEVETLSIDDYLERMGVHGVDVIKIDVQGYEGYVIEGMKKTIAKSRNLKMLMEFFPKGLSNAGTNPLLLLKEFHDLSFSLYEIRKNNQLIKITDLALFTDGLKGRAYSNILILGPDADFNFSG